MQLPDLSAHGFTQWYKVEGRSSIADLLCKKERCGLYVLLFQNGELYAGQAVDIARRYTQHRQTHSDIYALTCKAVARDRLNAEEMQLIHALEPLHPLRNLQHMSVVTGERDLDLILAPDTQQDFLAAAPLQGNDMPPVNWDADLSRRYQSRFDRFSALPYAAEATELLRMYILSAIPAPRLTEITFWTVSCLPTGSKADSCLIFRVSLNMQEVFSLFWAESEQVLWGSFHLAESPLIELFGNNWAEQFEAASVEMTEHRYRAGGHDQRHLVLWGMENLAIGIEELYPAMRLLNLRLMQKGPCYYSQFHCPQMVNAALKPHPPSPLPT